MRKQQQIIKYGFVIIVSFCLISGFEFNIQGQEQLQAEPTCGDGNMEKESKIKISKDEIRQMIERKLGIDIAPEQFITSKIGAKITVKGG